MSQRQCRHHHLLRDLHWLPVRQRVEFKIASLTYRIRSSSPPSYLSSLIADHAPSRNLRSPDMHLLQTPRVRTVISTRAFSSSAPKIWNGLPVDVQMSETLLSFRHKLKTFYFAQAFDYPANCPRLRFIFTIALILSMTMCAL